MKINNTLFNFKYFSKRLISFLMAFILCFNVLTPAISTYAEESTYTDEETIYSNEEKSESRITVKNDSVIIDGIEIKKEDFIKAFSSLKRDSQSPLSCALLDYNAILSNEVKAAGGLAAVGIGVTMMFARFVYKLNLATIEKKGMYSFPSGTFNGIDRAINFSFTDDTVVFDSIVFGLCWMTYELADYVAEHQSIIEETVFDFIDIKEGDIKSEDVDWDLNENSINHIKTGTGGRHLNGWRKFGQDPNDPNFYNNLLLFFKKAVDNGEIIKIGKGSGSDSTGWYVYFRYYIDKAGTKFELVVNIFFNYVENKGIENPKISDAWIVD